MKMDIYTLDMTDIKPMERYIPEVIINNVSEDGYYTLGAVCYPDGKAHIFGMAQFYVDSMAGGDCYGELTYVYVEEEYRRQSVGIRLTGKADSLLASEDVDVLMARISAKEDVLSGEPDADEVSAFLKACGFIATKDDAAPANDGEMSDTGELRFFRFTGR